MKNRIKKILTTSLISAMTLTTIGVASAEQISAKQTQKTQAISAHKTIEETQKEASAKGSAKHQIGKIVETATYSNDGLKTYTRSNGANYLSDKPSTIEENLSTNSNEHMSLFVLSETPYITFSSDENNSRFNMFVNFTRTNSGAQTNTDQTSKHTYSNEDNLKRAILMVYTNELCSGNITLSAETKTELENQLNSSSDINSIISILENNLSSSSPYYGKNLNNLSFSQISQNASNSEYKDLATRIMSTFNLNADSSSTINAIQNRQSTNSQTNSTQNQNTTQINRGISQTQNTTSQTNIANQNNTSTLENNSNLNRNYQRNQIGSNQNDYLNTTQNQSNFNNTNRRYYRNNFNQRNNSSSQATFNQNTNQSTQSDSKTMRADRTQNIDYISSGTRFNNSMRPRATRTPYTETQQTR